MDLATTASIRYFLPELALTAAALIVILADLVISEKSILGDAALVFTAAALVLIGAEPRIAGAWLFNRMLV
jgi:uncharacterized membrane protein YoaK (UPF0700 family)